MCSTWMKHAFLLRPDLQRHFLQVHHCVNNWFFTCIIQDMQFLCAHLHGMWYTTCNVKGQKAQKERITLALTTKFIGLEQLMPIVIHTTKQPCNFGRMWLLENFIHYYFF